MDNPEGEAQQTSTVETSAADSGPIAVTQTSESKKGGLFGKLKSLLHRGKGDVAPSLPATAPELAVTPPSLDSGTDISGGIGTEQFGTPAAGEIKSTGQVASGGDSVDTSVEMGAQVNNPVNSFVPNVGSTAEVDKPPQPPTPVNPADKAA